MNEQEAMKKKNTYVFQEASELLNFRKINDYLGAIHSEDWNTNPCGPNYDTLLIFALQWVTKESKREVQS